MPLTNRISRRFRVAVSAALVLPVALAGTRFGVFIVAKAAGIPSNAEGIGGFVNGARALVTPALVMVAAVAPLSLIAGGVRSERLPRRRRLRWRPRASPRFAAGCPREPPAISRKREWRPIEPSRGLRLAHDLHGLGWAIELHHLAGDAATDHWRTPRYATGRYPVPQAGAGRDRHPITTNEIPIPDGQAIIGLQLKTFTEVKPDLSLELRVDAIKLTFDLLVELDLTARPSYNRDKFLAYDAFLCGWSLAHPRYRTQRTRPAVVFVCPNPHAALACAREADDLMTGRIGVMGTGPEHWYHAGRDHTFFTIEADLHHGNLAALALPPQPPGLRDRLTGQRELEITRVELLPHNLLKR